MCGNYVPLKCLYSFTHVNFWKGHNIEHISEFRKTSGLGLLETEIGAALCAIGAGRNLTFLAEVNA